MKKSRAAWMRDGKFGMMVHWIPPGPPPQYGRRLKDINKAVDRFDVARFLADFRRSGADWLILTIGQNSGVTFNVGIFQEGVVGSATVERLAELATRLSR